MRSFRLQQSVVLAAVAGLCCVQAASADVFSMSGTQKSLLFAPIGDVNNTADNTGAGRVTYGYQMGVYDVTAAQYAEFLNAVARTDDYGLWNSSMGVVPSVSTDTWGSITRSGTPGNYNYLVRTGRENLPANYISWGSAARFANWLSNGQPTTGVENASTTERGSYTLDGAISSASLAAITRNTSGATYVIPTQNEWYKAAYYKGNGLNAGYWDYPTQSDVVPSNVLSTVGMNNANYYNNGYTDPVNGLTDVGSFLGSPGAYGTYDMGGEIWVWTEAKVSSTNRGVQGGSFAGIGSFFGGNNMLSTNVGHYWFDAAYSTDGSVGFRIAMVPEPASLGFLAGSGIVLLARRTRRRTRA